MQYEECPKHERIKYDSIGKGEEKLVMYVLSRIIVNTMNNITSAKIEALMRGIKGISIMGLPRYRDKIPKERNEIVNAGLLVVKSSTPSRFIVASNAPMPRTRTVVRVYTIRSIRIKVCGGSRMLISWERCQKRAVGREAGHGCVR